MSKKLLLILIIITSTVSNAQVFSRSMFAKKALVNLENFDKQRVHFGFYLGFNNYDFKIDKKHDDDDIIEDVAPRVVRRDPATRLDDDDTDDLDADEDDPDVNIRTAMTLLQQKLTVSTPVPDPVAVSPRRASLRKVQPSNGSLAL